jgi:hypothetical protein
MFIASFLAERMSPFTIIASVSIIIICFSSAGLIRNHD